MAGHPLPEILRLSLQDLALRIKILKVKIGTTIAEGLSRALDPPLLVNITRAVNSLIEVGALTTLEQITPMGLLLSRLPVDVHLGEQDMSEPSLIIIHDTQRTYAQQGNSCCLRRCFDVLIQR